MAQTVTKEKELKPPLPSVVQQKETQQPNTPKLSLKYLHGLLIQLQNENILLTQRVGELEQQIHAYQQSRGEVAITLELPHHESTDITANMQPSSQTDFIPRSERHPNRNKNKKSFWSVWFGSKANSSRQAK